MSVSSTEHIASTWGFYEYPFPYGETAVRGSSLRTCDDWLLLLKSVAHRLECDKIPVAASQFTKWYCRALCGVLYSLSMEDRFVSASFDEISLLFPGEPPFAVGTSGASSRPDSVHSRSALRERTLRACFAGNFDIVFHSLTALTGIRSGILWENASMYIHYFYRTWIAETGDAARRRILQDDYDYIVKHAQPELFGAGHRVNPFIGTGNPVRNTCCLRYHLPDGRTCKGCPISVQNRNK
ncbi:(2Fe-2S)-binding protein [Paenibacillus alkalitolerans]|uniref:(2Fe-2S)-binding protein n=1 Tax=Paenibacillus alkalitolerans TaxID=2799335 RepID=UPI0018F4411E|nr:(2Fe-2S)-binding protein [Paenibacillus alkalitolerans]